MCVSEYILISDQRKNIQIYYKIITIMRPTEYKLSEKKWVYTLMTTLLFLLIAHPATYQMTNSLFRGVFRVANKAGCPTMAGFLLHALVFTILLRWMMEANYDKN